MENWKTENNSLNKTYTFLDFKTAMTFMLRAAFTIEKHNHHPEWTNVYNQVHIKLTTHDAGNTITEKDHNLAQALDEIAQKFLNH